MRGISRRDFFRRGAGAAAAGTCACGLTGCATFSGVGSTPRLPAAAYTLQLEQNRVRIDLTESRELSKAGGAIKIVDERLSDDLIVARTGEATFTAVSLHCTHRGVELEYRHGEGHFQCASLGSSTFGLGGKNLGGPAERPAKTYPVELEEDAIVIVLG